MPIPPRARPTPVQLTLAALSGLCYAVGYPVALIGGWFGGWVLVSLGGVILLVLGAVTVARVHASSRSGDARPGPPSD